MKKAFANIAALVAILASSFSVHADPISVASRLLDWDANVLATGPQAIGSNGNPVINGDFTLIDVGGMAASEMVSTNRPGACSTSGATQAFLALQTSWQRRTGKSSA